MHSQSYYENSSIYLILNSTADENSTYSLMKNSPFTKELKEALENIPSVTEIYPSKILDCEISALNDAEGTNIEIVLNSIVGTSSFEALLVEEDMPYSQSTINIIPIIVNRSSLYYERTGFGLKLGDYISASVDIGKSMKEVDFLVCGFIENKDTGSVFYPNPEYLDFFAEMNCDLAWYICTDDTQTNTCITNTVIRLHDYALLEAAGMTKLQIQQVQGAENRIYFFNSLIGSCILGIPLGFFLCSKIAKISGISYISYKFPWTFLIFYIVFVFIVHVMVTWYQRHILIKYFVIERIRMRE